jgi:hypothetical protein
MLWYTTGIDSERSDMPTFDEFRADVLAKMTEWGKALANKGQAEARLVRDEAEDLIAGWKNAYPRRINEIRDTVDRKRREIFE